MKRLLFFLFPVIVFAARVPQPTVADLQKEIDEYKKMNFSLMQFCAPSGVGLFFEGEFLYWIAQEDNLAFILKDRPVDFSGQFVFDTIEQFNIHFDPGFRICTGYHFPWINWDLSLKWTRYKTNTSNGIEASPTETLNSIWGTPINILEDALQPGSSQSWKLTYNTLDLILEPSFLGYQFFSFQPKIGLRGAWIDQKLFLFGNIAPNGIFFMDGKSDFKSIGILGGFDTRWHMSRSFFLFGNLLGSLVYGQYKIRQNEPHLFGTTTLSQLTATEKYERVRSNFHLNIGLRWEESFFSDRLCVSIWAGYEQLIWFNQNRFRQYRYEQSITGNFIPQPTFERADLGISGWNVGANLEF